MEKWQKNKCTTTLFLRTNSWITKKLKILHWLILNNYRTVNSLAVWKFDQYILMSYHDSFRQSSCSWRVQNKRDMIVYMYVRKIKFIQKMICLQTSSDKRIHTFQTTNVWCAIYYYYFLYETQLSLQIHKFRIRFFGTENYLWFRNIQRM